MMRVPASSCMHGARYLVSLSGLHTTPGPSVTTSSHLRRHSKSRHHSRSWTTQSCSLYSSKIAASSYVKGLKLLPSFFHDLHGTLLPSLRLQAVIRVLVPYDIHSVCMLLLLPQVWYEDIWGIITKCLATRGFQCVYKHWAINDADISRWFGCRITQCARLQTPRRSDFLPWRNCPYDDKEGGNDWFSCLKNWLRSLTLFWHEIYSREKREASFFSMITSFLTLEVDFVIGSLNIYTLFLGMASEIAFTWLVSLSCINDMYCSWPRAFCTQCQYLLALNLQDNEGLRCYLIDRAYILPSLFFPTQSGLCRRDPCCPWLQIITTRSAVQ